MLDVDAVRELVPQLNTDDVLGATFCPIEGYATPEAVVQGYAAAARRLGARIKVGTRAVEILTDSAGIAGVRTPTETISTRTVVIAAGVGSAQLAAPLGFELPVHGEARTMYYSGTSGCVPTSSPLVVDFSTSFYFHSEGPGLVFGGREATLEELSEPAVHRLPTHRRRHHRVVVVGLLRRQSRPQRDHRAGPDARRALRHRLLRPRVHAVTRRR